MTKSKNYTIAALLVPFLIALLFEIGMGCHSQKEPAKEPVFDGYEYHVDIQADSVFIFDRDGEPLDTFITNGRTRLDSAFLKDKYNR